MFPDFGNPFGGGPNNFGPPRGSGFSKRQPMNPMGPHFGDDDIGHFNIDMYAPPDMVGPDAGVGFPNTPDFNPQMRPGRPQPRMDPPAPARPGLGNFAPPGTMPQVGSGNSPNLGVDGSGGLLMTKPPQQGAMPVKGDFDQMQRMGLIDPPFDPDKDHHFDNMYI